MNPIEFKQKVTTNVEHVIGRINGIAPQYITEEVKPHTVFVVYKKARDTNDRMKSEWDRQKRIGMLTYLCLDVQEKRRDGKQRNL